MNQPNKIQNYVFSYHFWLQFCSEVMDRFDQDSDGRQDEHDPEDDTRSGKHTQVH